jgi:alpha-galactosidase
MKQTVILRWTKDIIRTSNKTFSGFGELPKRGTKVKRPGSKAIAGAARLSVPAAWLLAAGVCLVAGCGKKPAPAAPSTPASHIVVTVNPGGPVTIKSSEAEFDILPSGYIQAFLLKGGQRSTLDDPAEQSGDSIVVNGKPVPDVSLDLSAARISDAHGKIGDRGKRVEISGRSPSLGLEKTLAIEVYDDFPGIAVNSLTVKNTGSAGLHLEKISEQHHRLNASLSDPQAKPHEMWSFHGASIKWGKENVFEIPEKFSQQNQMGSLVQVKGDLGTVGGGIPVVAFWTAHVGEAIGHIETLPMVVALPVSTEANGAVDVSMDIVDAATLGPGETYSTPRSFVAVYAGDYYEPLSLYSTVLDREGLGKTKPTDEDYGVSWCGWGYEFNVTPAQMLGTVPKLKEFGIHWATLDDRWFNDYGDWEPRSDTFPGDAIQKMVQDFHKDGIKLQLWWLPLAAEDGHSRYESHQYTVSKVVREHPDWLVLDKNGKPARMARNLATLCPAVPEVQQYYKQLTEKFIRDWDFDGSKLDNIYSVPACYNPKHHHKSPYDSIYAMGEVYKIIFETTRALKPESVTQSCPCGTPPNLAWFRYMDQAVTADPVGSGQVRRRIKMYKALLGPQAAVYGDHVELTKITGVNAKERDLGRDFASTLGTGGVLGTKFTWPADGSKYKDVYLTSDKETEWKRWIGIYNQKMLSRGTFRNLYVYGYDVPEGYAIEKDGVMYYAFFSPDPRKPWKGEIELRGLEARTYKVTEYVEGKELGTVTGPTAKLPAEFTEHLLLEVTAQ